MITSSLRTLMAGLLAIAASAAAAANASASDLYNQTILNDKPVMFLGMDTPGSGSESDLSGGGHNGTYEGGTPGTATLPNGDTAADFNGSSEYLSVPSAAAFWVPTTGAITIESWMRPDTLQFPNSEAEGYVYWLGKGNATQGYEYANRMYSYTNTADRPNRISDYDWNVSGGLGSGAYFQDPVTAGQWIYVTDVIDENAGYISIYKNGVLAEQVPLSQYSVTPGETQAPFNVGTRDLASWFEGAVGKVAVYNYVLTQAQITAHYNAMSTPSTGSTSGSTGSTGTSTGTTTVSLPSGSGCLDSVNTWQNSAFASQSGSFTAAFDATASSAADDGVAGLSDGSASAFTSLAAAVRFNESGTIDARNGASYTAANSIPYTAGKTYHFVLNVNVPAQTYSAYVTPPGGTQQTIGTGYAFRTGTAASLLNDLGLDADVGGEAACNLAVSGVAAPTVSITAPAAGASVSGTVSVTASASSSLGISGVQFKLDGANLGSEATASPYAVSWNTAQTGNGSHSLTAVAYDTQGNASTSTAVAVTVANSALPSGSGCLDSVNTWQNSAFASQSGSFTAAFDATASSAADDGVAGFSDGSASAFTSLAAAVRFNETGTIDARNGASYVAANSIPYTPGKTYHFVLDVNVKGQTYSAYVTPPGGTQQTIGTGYAFRTGTAASLLDDLGLDADVGGEAVCGVSVAAAASAPAAPAAPLPPALGSVAATEVSQTGAVITWSTNQPADSEVNYGTTPAYGKSEDSATLATSHSVTLSGLSAGTTYHYQVRSKNAAGVMATSGDFTFTTAAAEEESSTPVTVKTPHAAVKR